MGLSVSGANILVTGASSGIGAALAPRLAERGATVGLVARRAERLRAVLEQCRAHTARSRSWVVDLSDPSAAEQVALEAWDTFDGLDVVVNNAAIPKRRRVLDLAAEEIEAVMRTNFISPVRLTLAVLPRMLERSRGVVVNISSLGGRLGIGQEAAYCASKFALSGWTESMALDLWHSPVEVRLVTPGAIETEIWDKPDNEPPLYDGPKEPAGIVAEAIIEAIEGDRFETYVPDLKSVAEFKAADIDAFLAGAAQLGADG